MSKIIWKNMLKETTGTKNNSPCPQYSQDRQDACGKKILAIPSLEEGVVHGQKR